MSPVGGEWVVAVTYVDTNAETEEHSLDSIQERQSPNKQTSTYLEPKDTKEMGPPYKLKPNEDSLQPWVTELSHTSAGNTN